MFSRLKKAKLHGNPAPTTNAGIVKVRGKGPGRKPKAEKAEAKEQVSQEDDAEPETKQDDSIVVKNEYDADGEASNEFEDFAAAAGLDAVVDGA